MNNKQLLDEFAAKFIRILNFGNLPVEKQIEISRLINDPKYSTISSLSMSNCKFFSTSFFQRHRNTDSLVDGRKGRSGRKSCLHPDDEHRIKALLFQRHNDYLFISVRWTQQLISDQVGHQLSLSFAYSFLKRIGWRSVHTQLHHPKQHTETIESLITNFFSYICDFIITHNITPDKFHIMDETGIITNMIPKYTFAPKGEPGYVIGSTDNTKDTAVVTATANGSGFLFFIPHREKTIITLKDGTKKEIREIKGVGISEMIEWTKQFTKYAQSGDLLIMDNLGSHKNQIVLDYLKSKNIYVEFFPIRSAFVLSVLDNAFFAVFKNRLAYENMSDDNKAKIIQEVFSRCVKDGHILSMFDHCRYSEIFPAKADGSSFEELFIPIQEYNETYGVFPDFEIINIADVLGFIPAQIYDNHGRAMVCAFAFIAFNTYIMSALESQSHLIHNSDVLSIIYSFQTSKKLQFSKSFKKIQNKILHVEIENEHEQNIILLKTLKYSLHNLSIRCCIYDYKLKERIEYDYLSLIQTDSLLNSIELYLNIKCTPGYNIKRIEECPDLLIINILYSNDNQFDYPSNFDLSPYCISGKGKMYELQAVFSKDEKNIYTVYEKYDYNGNKMWLSYSNTTKISDEWHVFQRLKMEIGYGKCCMLVYKAEYTTYSKVDCNIISHEKCYPLPIININNQKSTVNIIKENSQKVRIEQNIQSIINKNKAKQIIKPVYIIPQINTIQNNEDTENTNPEIDNLEIYKNIAILKQKIKVIITDHLKCLQSYYVYDKGDLINKLPHLTNTGNVCYINCILHLIYFIPEFKEIILNNNFESPLIQSIKKILCKMHSNASINTRLFFPALFNQQSDVEEFFTHIVNELVNDYKNEMDSLLGINYKGENNVSYIVHINVNEFNSIQEGVNDAISDTSPLPKYIMVHLLRYDYNAKENKILKNYKYILPNNNLKINNQNYGLISITTHNGDYRSGHYINYLNFETNWVSFNDSIVRYVQKEEYFYKIHGDDYLNNIYIQRPKWIDKYNMNQMYMSLRTSYLLVYSRETVNNEVITIDQRKPTINQNIINIYKTTINDLKEQL